MTDTLRENKLTKKRPSARQPAVPKTPVDVQVVHVRQDVTVDQAAVEIAAYVQDNEGADSVDLFEALRIPIHIIEQAAERLVSQGKLRHVP